MGLDISFGHSKPITLLFFNHSLFWAIVLLHAPLSLEIQFSSWVHSCPAFGELTTTLIIIFQIAWRFSTCRPSQLGVFHPKESFWHSHFRSSSQFLFVTFLREWRTWVFCRMRWNGNIWPWSVLQLWCYGCCIVPISHLINMSVHYLPTSQCYCAPYRTSLFLNCSWNKSRSRAEVPSIHWVTHHEISFLCMLVMVPFFSIICISMRPCVDQFPSTQLISGWFASGRLWRRSVTEQHSG